MLMLVTCIAQGDAFQKREGLLHDLDERDEVEQSATLSEQTAPAFQIRCRVFALMTLIPTGRDAMQRLQFCWLEISPSQIYRLSSAKLCW